MSDPIVDRIVEKLYGDEPRRVANLCCGHLACQREVEELLIDYTRWLFDRTGVHEKDGRFTKLVPEFLDERSTR